MKYIKIIRCQGLRWGMELPAKGHEGTLCGDGEIQYLILVVVTWLFRFVQVHRTTLPKRVNFTARKS